MHRNFKDLNTKTMEAKDYLKSKNIWLGTTVVYMKAPENHYSLEKMLDEYHQAKLKLLGIADVVGQSEQFCCSSFEAGEWRCETQCLGCAGLEEQAKQ